MKTLKLLWVCLFLMLLTSSCSPKIIFRSGMETVTLKKGSKLYILKKQEKDPFPKCNDPNFKNKIIPYSERIDYLLVDSVSPTSLFISIRGVSKFDTLSQAERKILKKENSSVFRKNFKRYETGSKIIYDSTGKNITDILYFYEYPQYFRSEEIAADDVNCLVFLSLINQCGRFPLLQHFIIPYRRNEFYYRFYPASYRVKGY